MGLPPGALDRWVPVRTRFQDGIVVTGDVRVRIPPGRAGCLARDLVAEWRGLTLTHPRGLWSLTFDTWQQLRRTLHEVRA